MSIVFYPQLVVSGVQFQNRTRVSTFVSAHLLNAVFTCDCLFD